ncbi:N-ethylmaleimide reductase (plasmid) [Piscirickettsia salmonis]|nr:N-ethylmaleimide reductase [Piscirickettsia salmonis]QGP66935.1 N-ethylmaleimide reductase [Piscirickettsia salmonis]
MAPMTRRFADNNGCPNKKSIDYYGKRSDAGLIITEGTLISEDAIGYGNIPGIYTDEQIRSWEAITKDVHTKKGHIFLQIWHCGRVSHPHFHKGRLPISSSATHMTTALGNSGFVCGEAREATLDDIENIIEQYSQAAQNAIEAGFDGVEIHGANGYLIDQFLHYCTNKRIDEYGGTPENMAKFCIQVVQECINKIGSSRVGIRLSPAGHMAEISTHNDDKEVFKTLFKALESLNICYIHTGNFDDSIIHKELDYKNMTTFIRDNYHDTVIASGGYNIHQAQEFIASSNKNLIAFGRPFIANPNLIEKIIRNDEWLEYNKNMLNSLA